VTGCYEHGNEPSDSIKCSEFVTEMNICRQCDAGCLWLSSEHSSLVQVVGRSVPRECERCRDGEVAAGVGGPGACQHHVHTGFP
jgi:hypothetical protein